MKRIIFLIVILTFYSCSSNNHKISNEQKPCPNDTSLLSTYKKELAFSAEQDREFIKNLIQIIQNFQCRPLDTTIFSTGKIDIDLETDTILTRVFDKNDTIRVQYSWTKNGKLLWRYEFQNPYSWYESELFQYDKRSKWVTFTIGVYYASPEIGQLKIDTGFMDFKIKLGIADMNSQGIALDYMKYKNYLIDFKGDIITWGDPESRDGTFIWYEPLKRFVLYYHP